MKKSKLSKKLLQATTMDEEEPKKQPIKDKIKPLQVPTPPPPLTGPNVQLFNLVVLGKIQLVIELIKKEPVGDLNRLVDEHGYTVWHVAIRRQDEAMLRYLLTYPKIEMLYDLLLHAIHEQNKSIILTILECIEFHYPRLRIPSCLSRWKYSEYAADITPIILSAQIGSYELIKFFFDRGEPFNPKHARTPGDNMVVSTPTDPSKASDMSINYIRLHEYQTIASPAMLCYKTNTVEGFDPILEGFELLVELERVESEEHEFGVQYRDISKKLRNFLTSFLDECKTSEDVQLLLSKKEGYHGRQDKYPRLMMAIELKIYEFVTHGHSQKLLYMQWVGDSWPAWKAMSIWSKIFQVLIRFLFTPLICIWLYFDIFSTKAKFFRAPINRCIHHFVSYTYFMIILGVEAYFFTTKEANVHDTPCKILELFIILFVSGHIVSLIRHFLITPKHFFIVRWYDLVTTTFFLATFGFWITTWYTEMTEPVQTPRTHWKYYDSVLMGEATFSIALVLAYGAFMRFFQLNYWTGPMQIAMASMIQDLVIFAFFFGVILLSFGLGFYFLYSPFHGFSYVDSGGKTQITSGYFTTYLNALHTLYWGLLAMAEPKSTDIIQHKDTNSSAPYTALHLTQHVGQGLFMLFHLLGAMVLMNMLTGYMGNTFSRISSNMIPTWKFNRTQVWVYYIRNTVMPAPFNLIPSLKDFCLAYKWLISSRDKDGEHVAACSIEACCYLEKREDSQAKSIRAEKYSQLMKALTQRYLRSRLLVNEMDLATNEDVEQIMEDVGQLKRILNEKLHPDSIKLPTNTSSQEQQAQNEIQSDDNGNVSNVPSGISECGPNDKTCKKRLEWHKKQQYIKGPLFNVVKWTAMSSKPKPSFHTRQNFTSDQVQSSPNLRGGSKRTIRSSKKIIPPRSTI